MIDVPTSLPVLGKNAGNTRHFMLYIFKHTYNAQIVIKKFTDIVKPFMNRLFGERPERLAHIAHQKEGKSELLIF